jgi:excisionase family DNA binding protein
MTDTNNNEDKKTGRVDDASKLDIKNLPDLLTVREVADLLRVSPLTIKRWGKRGKLPAIRINSRGDRRYKKEAVLWLLGMNPETDTE